jgi:hypothetical protein
LNDYQEDVFFPSVENERQQRIVDVERNRQSNDIFEGATATS